MRRQTWATDYGEIRSRTGAVVNAGTRTWCIGNTRRKLSSGHARRGDERPRLSNVKRGRRENLRMEANLSFWRSRRSNKFFNGGKNLGELLIVLLLKRFDLASKVAVGAPSSGGAVRRCA